MVHKKFVMSKYSNKEALYKAQSEYYKNLVYGYEKRIGDPAEDIYVVVASRDTFELEKSTGAIVFETLTGKATLSNAVEFSDRLQGRYGETVICKLVTIGDSNVCETIINSPAEK